MQILFYSNYCAHSADCINKLDSNGLLVKLQKVCVDRDQKTKTRHPAVAKFGITSVPVIIWGDQKLTGAQVFSWIKHITSSGKSTRNERFDKTPQQQQTQQQEQTPASVEGFSNDSPFASINQTNLINPPNETGDVVQKTSSFVVPTGMLSASDQRKMDALGSGKKASGFNKEMEQLLKERENSMPNIPKVI